MGSLFQQKWLLAWRWNFLRWRIEVICKLGRFSHKAVTFSKTRSSALLNCCVLRSSFPPKLKCRCCCWNPVLIHSGGYSVLPSSIPYTNWCDACLWVTQSTRNDPELCNIYMNFYNKKFRYVHEINLKFVKKTEYELEIIICLVAHMQCNAKPQQVHVIDSGKYTIYYWQYIIM